MAKAPGNYARLTRNAAGLAAYSSLWLAADHLLLVSSTGYSESYSRLQLRDIQAVCIVRTDRRLWWGLAWGGIALFSGTIAVVDVFGQETPIASSIFFALGLGLFIWNHLLGPGCRTYVTTSVQTTELPSLVRVKKAHRVLARLQPLIEAAQVDLKSAPQAPPPGPPPVPLVPPAA